MTYLELKKILYINGMTLCDLAMQHDATRQNIYKAWNDPKRRNGKSFIDLRLRITEDVSKMKTSLSL